MRRAVEGGPSSAASGSRVRWWSRRACQTAAGSRHTDQDECAAGPVARSAAGAALSGDRGRGRHRLARRFTELRHRPAANSVSNLNLRLAFDYEPVSWRLAFSQASWIGTAPDLTIDGLSGSITSTPDGLTFSALTVGTPRSHLTIDGTLDRRRSPSLFGLTVASRSFCVPGVGGHCQDRGQHRGGRRLHRQGRGAGAATEDGATTHLEWRRRQGRLHHRHNDARLAQRRRRPASASRPGALVQPARRSLGHHRPGPVRHRHAARCAFPARHLRFRRLARALRRLRGRRRGGARDMSADRRSHRGRHSDGVRCQRPGCDSGSIGR